eukprot:TRINITY_DN48594_c0_g1_i1.p1 TRINITY_DN48594_c0_g1~~TRINITY_DN48594_c0_g1_i1.p1  ORF type:complete len:645 (-),score=98.23 TRINITY_DN48594_c0_g1_i1:72-2006(-)
MLSARQASARRHPVTARHPLPASRCQLPSQLHASERSLQMMPLPLTVVAIPAVFVRQLYKRSRSSKKAVMSRRMEGSSSGMRSVIAEKQPLASLPTPGQCWALVTGATSPVGRELARLCSHYGFGVMLIDRPDQQSELEILAAEFSSRESRVHTAAIDLEAGGMDTLRGDLAQRGMDVEVLVASHGGADAQLLQGGLGSILAKVSITADLCRTFAADMVAAGRGRILVTAGPPDTSSELIKRVVGSLDQELLTSGVGISYLELTSVESGSLKEKLSSTCLDFLVSSSSDVPGEQGLEEVARTGPDSSNTIPIRINSPYAQLAKDRDFPILPYAEDIDTWQRFLPAEIASALLTGLTCMCFALKTLPEFANLKVLSDIEGCAAIIFSIEYMMRWYSRGLRWDFLLQKYMVLDLLSLLCYLSTDINLNFMRLLRTVRVYRLLEPREIRKLYKDAFNIESEDALPAPSRLMVIRAFGATFTLLFITAGLMYTAEHDVNPQFKNFFSAFYFSVTALSTVGFGDITPITPAGQTVMSLAIPIALCLVPFQASQVAGAFAEEARIKSLNFQKRQASKDRQIQSLVLSLERERAKTQSDAERLRMLEKKESERQPRSVKDLRDMFNSYDVDKNGSIEFPEFLLMAESLGLL